MVNSHVFENQIFRFCFYSIWYSFLLLAQLVMNMKIIRMNEKRINLSLNPKQINQNKNTQLLKLGICIVQDQGTNKFLLW
jgi:hypothetical protein